MSYNMLPGVPIVESPLFEGIVQSGFPTESLEVAQRLRRDGFAVIDLPEPDFNQLAATIIRKLDKHFDWDAWRSGKVPDLRMQDAWKNVPEVKQIACNPRLLGLLSDLYGRRAFPFQTLNFAVGTQQHFHSDSLHFSSEPERFMVGVWVALEDIDASNGPLIYFPGSHALPIFTNEHIGVNPDWTQGNPYGHYGVYEKLWEQIVGALNLKPVEFHAKKGQALIWAANLLHGGAAQRDLKRTRYSQVTHYFFEGCSYYTPMGSVPFLGPIQFREITDVSSGKAMANSVNGMEVAKPHIEYTKPTRVPLAPQLPADFNAQAYLRANPDVAAAGADPVAHWKAFGYRENRRYR